MPRHRRRCVFVVIVTLAAAAFTGCPAIESDAAARQPEEKQADVRVTAAAQREPALVISGCLDNSGSVTKEFFEGSTSMLARLIEERALDEPRGPTRLTLRTFGAVTSDSPASVLRGIGPRPAHDAPAGPFAADPKSLDERQWEKQREEGRADVTATVAALKRLDYQGIDGSDLWNCVDAAVGSLAGLRPNDRGLLLLLSDFVDRAGEDVVPASGSKFDVVLVRTCSGPLPDHCRAGVEAAKQRLAHLDPSIVVFSATDLPALGLDSLGLRRGVAS